jgi:hypothetical protein
MKKAIYRKVMEEQYNDNDIIDYTSKKVVNKIKDIIQMLIEKLKILLEEDIPKFLYTLHISIIIRRLLLELANIIDKKILL